MFSSIRFRFGPRIKSKMACRRWGLGMLVVVALLVVNVPAAAAQTPGPAPDSPTPVIGGSQTNASQPHEETLEARVLSASAPQPCAADASSENKVDPLTGKSPLCQKVELLVTKGSTKGETIKFDEGTIPVAGKANVVYRQGDMVYVDWEYGTDQPSTYHIIDYIRTGGLWVLAAMFVALAVLFGRLRGFTSLLGLVISFGVLIFYVVPRIAAGDDPVRTSIGGALVIMVVTMYLSHGFNLKTTSAICGTAISLIFRKPA